MNDIRFKPKRGRARTMRPEFSAYVAAMAEDSTQEHNRLKRNLGRAMREELTPRQRQVLVLYYMKEMNIVQIAELLHVCPSTVYRTLHRGEGKLLRCLRYGAERYLRGLDQKS